MPAPYSRDLRERVIGFMALGGSARAAATRFEVSISSAARWAQRWRAEGPTRPRAMGGDHRSRSGEHGARVLRLVAQQPDLTPRETGSALAAGCGIPVALSTGHRFLGAHKLTHKKTLHAAEQDRPDVAQARRVFIRRQPALDPNRLVFVDETPACAGAGCGPLRTWRGAMVDVPAACGCGERCRMAAGN